MARLEEPLAARLRVAAKACGLYLRNWGEAGDEWMFAVYGPRDTESYVGTVVIDVATRTLRPTTKGAAKREIKILEGLREAWKAAA